MFWNYILTLIFCILSKSLCIYNVSFMFMMHCKIYSICLLRHIINMDKCGNKPYVNISILVKAPLCLSRTYCWYIISVRGLLITTYHNGYRQCKYTTTAWQNHLWDNRYFCKTVILLYIFKPHIFNPDIYFSRACNCNTLTINKNKGYYKSLFGYLTLNALNAFN